MVPQAAPNADKHAASAFTEALAYDVLDRALNHSGRQLEIHLACELVVEAKSIVRLSTTSSGAIYQAMAHPSAIRQ